MTETHWPYVPIIADVAARVAAAPDLGSLARDVFPTLVERLGAGSATIALLEHESLRPIGVVGPPGGRWSPVSLSDPAPMAAAARLRAPVVIHDARSAGPEFPSVRQGGARSLCALPLTVGERAVGAVELGWDRPRDLGPVDLQALTTVAMLLATACDGAPTAPGPRAPLNRLAPFTTVDLRTAGRRG
jgi:GAF domain-containing protein